MKVALPVYTILVIDDVLWVGIKDVPKDVDHFEVIATLKKRSQVEKGTKAGEARGKV